MKTSPSRTLLTGEEIAIALTRQGVDPDAERIAALQAAIGPVALPDRGRALAVAQAVEVASRALDAGVDANRDTADAAIWPYGAVAKFQLASAPDAPNGITFARRDAHHRFINTFDGEPIDPAVWTLVKERAAPQDDPVAHARAAHERLAAAQDAWEATHSEDQPAWNRLQAAIDAAHDADAVLALAQAGVTGPTGAPGPAGTTGAGVAHAREAVKRADREPGEGVPGTGTMQQGRKHPDARFTCQLLGRLQQDCDYYLGAGNRNKKHLWALDEQAQIDKMRELYGQLAEKPAWLTLQQIEQYSSRMLRDPDSELSSDSPETASGNESLAAPAAAPSAPSPGM